MTLFDLRRIIESQITVGEFFGFLALIILVYLAVLVLGRR